MGGGGRKAPRRSRSTSKRIDTTAAYECHDEDAQASTSDEVKARADFDNEILQE